MASMSFETVDSKLLTGLTDVFDFVSISELEDEQLVAIGGGYEPHTAKRAQLAQECAQLTAAALRLNGMLDAGK